MSVHRRKYDSDFKRNAVLLSEDPDRMIAEIADNLGIKIRFSPEFIKGVPINE